MINKRELIELCKIYPISKIAFSNHIAPNTLKKWINEAGIVLKKSRLNMSKLSLDKDYFKFIDSKEKAYWLGFICADGCIHRNYKKVSLVSKDKEVIEKFKKAIKSDHKLREFSKFDNRTNKTYYGCSIQIGNEIFYQHLINLGITPDKTDSLEMPRIDEQYYSYFFAGLFDGDGSVQEFTKINKIKKENYKIGHPVKITKCKISLISTLEILSFLQKYMIEKLDINSLKMTRITKNRNNVWKLYLYKDAKKFLDWIYNDETFPYLSRKYQLYMNIVTADASHGSQLVYSARFGSVKP